MSTTANGTATRTYRGRSLEEILPRIREELGPDAVLVRQREGLTGGIGGFFQRRCVEVEARAGAPRVDLYDELPELAVEDVGAADGFEPLDVAGLGAAGPELRNDAASREGLASPAMRMLIEQAQPFAEALDRAARDQAADAGEAPEAGDAPGGEAAHAAGGADFADEHGRVSGTPRGLDGEAATGSPRARRAAARAASPALVAGRRAPKQARVLARELAAAGIDPLLADAIVAESVSHLLPVARRDDVRAAVRRALARRIRTMPGWSGRGRALAFVGAGGSGKTSCAATLALAYAERSDVPALCLSLAPRDGGAALAAELEGSRVPFAVAADGDELRGRVLAARSKAAVIVDTPAVSVADRAAVARLSAELGRAGLYEVHLALPATLSAAAAREHLRALAAPLRASRVALTHAGETEHPGHVLGVAIETATPLSFVSPAPEELFAADPDELARSIV